MTGHDLLVILGGVPGTMNLLWGGFLSCLSEFAIVGVLAGAYSKHKCHEKRCWRLAKHHVEGTPYVACRKHHPGLPGKARKGDIARAFEKAEALAALSLPKPTVKGRRT
jgi:hypothetical protein